MSAMSARERMLGRLRAAAPVPSADCRELDAGIERAAIGGGCRRRCAQAAEHAFA
jgi:hypothetical protein